ncbi:MAG TPA: hypothetical protein DD727_01755 [Clostridiales bacterium]|nr:hypothetical protein [Clostridiales bacterium]
MINPECQKQDKNIFKRIIGENWEAFKRANPTYAQPQYEEAVWKALHCGSEQGGYTEFRCMNCGVGSRRIAFTCKSCFCLSCAKVYTDEIVSQISKMLRPGMKYRHVVLTIPEQLKSVFYRDRHNGKLLSELMRTGYQCMEEVVGIGVKRKVKTGMIAVLQTHGRSGHYNPHLHILMTSGGVDEEGKEWRELGYLPFETIHKKWQYHFLNMMKKEIPTQKMKQMVDELYRLYPKGFVANINKGEAPEKAKGLAKYLAKYMASPPISVRRIINYDGKTVTYCTTVLKGAYEVVASRKYRQRYIESCGKDPLKCSCCGHEMTLWLIWNPKYGVVYDEEKNIKHGKYERFGAGKGETEVGRVGKGNDGGNGNAVRRSYGVLQISLFPMQI